MSKIEALLTFLRNRLDERSTWLLIGAGITAASALPAPWSYYSLGASIIAALIPDGTVK